MPACLFINHFVNLWPNHLIPESPKWCNVMLAMGGLYVTKSASAVAATAVVLRQSSCFGGFLRHLTYIAGFFFSIQHARRLFFSTYKATLFSAYKASLFFLFFFYYSYKDISFMGGGVVLRAVPTS